MISSRQYWFAAAAGILLLACGRPVQGPAASCAEVVKTYRGLPNPVAVTATEGDAPGRVEIRYESTNVENIPVVGRAVCEFAVAAGRPPRLVAAEVDGAEVDVALITSVNRAAQGARQGE